MALASPAVGISKVIQISMSLQLHKMTSLGLPFRNIPDTCLTSAVFLSHRHKLHKPFLLSFIVKPDHMSEVAKFCCLLRLEHGSLVLLHRHRLSVFHGLLQPLSLAVLELDL